MGVEVAAAAAIVGAGVSAYGQYRSSQAQARAARQNAKLQQAQAKEMIERMEIQEHRMLTQGEEFKSKQMAMFAKGGVAVGTGATLVAMEDTNFKISTQIADMKRDTLFRANQIRLGAKYGIQQAGELSQAGAIMAGGTLLEGGARAYDKLN